jgi:hypothetical protein
MQYMALTGRGGNVKRVIREIGERKNEIER